MKKIVSRRFFYCIGFGLIIILLGMAFFLQKYKGLNPCPLCVLQRGVMMGLGAVFLCGILFSLNKWGHRLLITLSLSMSLLGLLFSGRQVWLQHIPFMGYGDCGVSLYYMLRIFSLTDVMQQVWRGGAECSQTGWMFLHLSLAEWSLICFGGFIVIIILQIKRRAID